MKPSVKTAIREYISVPDHIHAIADAICFDITHGPSWLIVPGGDVTRIDDDCLYTLYHDAAHDATGSGDIIEQTYTGAAADTLREFIDGLPSNLWVDDDCNAISETEPEGCWTPADDLGLEPDEDGEYDGYETDGDGNVWEEPFTENTYHCGASDIIAALFGNTIAREFR